MDIPALLALCAKQLAAVSVRLEGAEDQVFAARVQDAMARVGLTVTEKAGNAITVRLALRQTARKLPNDWTKINVAGSATVVDPATSNVAGSLQIDESGTDPDAGQAKSKMLDNAAKALAAAIVTMLKNPALRKQYGDAGRERVAKHFGLDRLVEGTLEAYQRIASR